MDEPTSSENTYGTVGRKIAFGTKDLLFEYFNNNLYLPTYLPTYLPRYCTALKR